MRDWNDPIPLREIPMRNAPLVHPGEPDIKGRDLSKLAQNVYIDINALAEKSEDHDDEIEKLTNSQMEAVVAYSDLLELVRSQHQTIIYLVASYKGLLARVNAVEAQSRERTRNLVARRGGESPDEA